MSPNSRLLDNSAAVRSMGLVVVAKLGRMPFSFLSVSSASFAIGMPTVVAASAVITQTAPELLMATSRLPFGFQPLRYSSVASTRPRISGARQMP